MVRVFLRAESPETHRPRHSASRGLAGLVVSLLAAKWVAEDAIQLTRAETWRQAKDTCRAVKRSKCLAVVVDSGMPLMLSYPQLGQESDALRRRRETWMRAEKF
jgi:hypothetical protein